MKTSKCDHQLVDQFLNLISNNPAVDDSALQAHLESCQECQSYFESRIASEDFWEEASQLLRSTEFDEAGSPECSAGSLGTVPITSLQVNDLLARLAPTDDPHSLGRIGGYEVSGVVGTGSMGVVLKAHDPALDRIVAIKVLSPHLANSGTARRRFEREARAVAAILHPNVIPIHSVSGEAELPYFVMSYIRGESLQSRINRDGPLEVEAILRIGHQVAAGLSAAHEKGLVHRDIKPANILLEGTTERVTITDFGLARAVDDVSLTRAGVIAGTPQYMSPEQSNAEHVDQRSDLFSLGSVLYALCTGRPPFKSQTSYGLIREINESTPTAIQELNPAVPRWLCRLVSRLLSKDKADRFQSAEKVRLLLEACLKHVEQPHSSPLPGSLVAEEPESLKTRFKQSLTIGVTMISTLLIAFICWQQLPQDHEAQKGIDRPGDSVKQVGQSATNVGNKKAANASTQEADSSKRPSVRPTPAAKAVRAEPKGSIELHFVSIGKPIPGVTEEEGFQGGYYGQRSMRYVYKKSFYSIVPEMIETITPRGIRLNDRAHADMMKFMKSLRKRESSFVFMIGGKRTNGGGSFKYYADGPDEIVLSHSDIRKAFGSGPRPLPGVNADKIDGPTIGITLPVAKAKIVDNGRSLEVYNRPVSLRQVITTVPFVTSVPITESVVSENGTKQQVTRFVTQEMHREVATWVPGRRSVETEIFALTDCRFVDLDGKTIDQSTVNERLREPTHIFIAFEAFQRKQYAAGAPDRNWMIVTLPKRSGNGPRLQAGYDSELATAIADAASVPTSEFARALIAPGPETKSVPKTVSESFSILLLKLPFAEKARENPSVLEDFRWISFGIPRPSSLMELVSSDAMLSTKPDGRVSMLQPKFIRILTSSATNNRITGSFAFEAPEVFKGRANFVAQRLETGEIEVLQFELPAYGIVVTPKKRPEGKQRDVSKEEATSATTQVKAEVQAEDSLAPTGLTLIVCDNTDKVLETFVVPDDKKNRNIEFTAPQGHEQLRVFVIGTRVSQENAELFAGNYFVGGTGMEADIENGIYCGCSAVSDVRPLVLDDQLRAQVKKNLKAPNKASVIKVNILRKYRREENPDRATVPRDGDGEVVVQAKPILLWIESVRSSDLCQFKTVWSKQAWKQSGIKRQEAKADDWSWLLEHHAELWVHQFPSSKIADFTFSYKGGQANGKVIVKFKGKEIDPGVVGPLSVLKENGKWKMGAIPHE